MGIRGDKPDKFNNFWWHLTNEYLEKNKKNAKYLFVENKSKYYTNHKQLTYVKTKYLTAVSPSAMDIIDNHVILFTYDDDILHCVHIHSKPIAKSFKSFFENLWNQGKK